jgi:hypothetical protein
VIRSRESKVVDLNLYVSWMGPVLVSTRSHFHPIAEDMRDVQQIRIAAALAFGDPNLDPKTEPQLY